MTLRLILTSLDPQIEACSLVPGPWIHLGDENLESRLAAADYADPFTDAESVFQDARQIRQLSEVLLVEVADQLNRRHGCSHTRTFWRILAMPWIIVIAQAAWVRWRQILALSQRHPDLTVRILAEDPVWDFPSHRQVWLDGLHTELFDFWLSSRVIRAVRPAGWRLEEIAVPASPATTPVPPPTEPNFPNRLLTRLTGRCLFRNVEAQGRLPAFLWTWYLRTIGLAARRRVPAPEPVPDWPDRLDPGFIALLRQLLQATLPRTLRDDFAGLAAKARAQSFRPGRPFVVGSGLYFDEPTKFEAAFASETGEVVVPVQHGGQYGLIRSHTDPAAVEFPHVMITWGWTRQEHHPVKAVPLPPPALSRLVAGRAQRSNGSLILVGTSMRVAQRRLMGTPRPGQMLAYRDAKIRFVNDLDAAPRSALRYRPYPFEAGALLDQPFFLRHFPDTPIVRGPLSEQMLACRLLVLDHPGTTVNLALAADVPLIAYWDQDAWPISRDGSPVIARLRAAGVVHDQPEAAAAQINRVWGDLDAWWASPEVRTARQEFLALYGRVDRQWWLRWAAALWRLNRGWRPTEG